MNYIIVDFEMNPLASEYIDEKQISRSEIIEIGAVIMDEQFLVLGEFKTLVKPEFNDCGKRQRNKGGDQSRTDAKVFEVCSR